MPQLQAGTAMGVQEREPFTGSPRAFFHLLWTEMHRRNCETFPALPKFHVQAESPEHQSHALNISKSHSASVKPILVWAMGIVSLICVFVAAVQFIYYRGS